MLKIKHIPTFFLTIKIRTFMTYSAWVLSFLLFRLAYSAMLLVLDMLSFARNLLVICLLVRRVSGEANEGV